MAEEKATIPDLRAWLRQELVETLSWMREVVEQTGELQSQAVLIEPDLTHQVMLLPFENDQEKKLYAAAFRHEVKEHQAIAALFCSDTWIAPDTDPDDPDGTRFVPRRRPADRPDRMECLICHGYTPDWTLWFSQIYHREPDGTIRWETVQTLDPLGEGHTWEEIYERFDPYPRPGRELEPTLDELGFQLGIMTKMVPFDRNGVQWDKAEELTDPAAIVAGQIIRNLLEELLTQTTDFPGQAPWQS